MRRIMLFRKWKTRLCGALLFLLPHLAMAQDGKWVVDPNLGGVAQDKPLCQNLLKHLNSYQGCKVGSMMATFPGFSDPPWQKLDPREHVELIYRLMMYQAGADRYFHRRAGRQLPPLRDTGNRRAVTDFIARGGELRVWRTRLFNDYGDLNHPAPPGQQTIVELRETFKDYAEEPGGCRGKPHLLGFGSTYVVTADLSGPDPNVDAGVASSLQSGELRMYEGTPYLVSVTGLVIRMQTSAHLPESYPPFHYCGFRFNEGGNQ